VRAPGARARLVALLALAAADELADLGHEHVHGGHGAPVVVLAHVEGLDGARVVEHDDRLPEHLLGQVALVLALQVHAPLHLRARGMPRSRPGARPRGARAARAGAAAAQGDSGGRTGNSNFFFFERTTSSRISTASV